MTNGVYGDAIPLFNVKGFAAKGDSDKVILHKLTTAIKKFIEKSIICFDTGLFYYSEQNTLERDEIEARAKQIMTSLKSGQFNKIYFMVLNVPYAIALPGDSAYPIGKFDKFKTIPENVIKGLFLNEMDRNRLIRSKNPNGLRQQLVDIFYGKFCQFIISERKKYESQMEHSVAESDMIKMGF